MSIPRVNFCFNVPNVSQLESVWSPEFKVQEIPWKIHLKKEILDKEATIAIYLYCTKENQLSSTWSHTACATFKFLSFNRNVNAFVYHLPPFIFDSVGINNFGCSKIMNWDELLNKDNSYVKDDTMNLDITIEAANPKDPNKSILAYERICNTNSISFIRNIFKIIISNVNNLMAVKSLLPVSLQRWDLTFYKADHHGSEYLKARLYKESMETNDHIILIELVTQKSEKILSNEFQKKCFQTSRTYNEIQIVSWTDLFDTDKGFVSKNSVVFNVEVISNDLVQLAENIRSLLPEIKFKTMQLKCAICFENMETNNVSSVPCGHIFCLECIEKSLKRLESCPSCRTPTDAKSLRRIYLPL